MQLHVFPEGRISYNGKIADLRWGIGKMVCDVMLHSGGRCAPWPGTRACWNLILQPLFAFSEFSSQTEPGSLTTDKECWLVQLCS